MAYVWAREALLTLKRESKSSFVGRHGYSVTVFECCYQLGCVSVATIERICIQQKFRWRHSQRNQRETLLHQVSHGMELVLNSLMLSNVLILLQLWYTRRAKVSRRNHSSSRTISGIWRYFTKCTIIIFRRSLRVVVRRWSEREVEQRKVSSARNSVSTSSLQRGK